MTPRPKAGSGLRTGWTTGTCASVAAKAAAIAVETGLLPREAEVALPSGKRVALPVVEPGQDFPLLLPQWKRAVVVKDAGDDPDCTNGARVTATVARLKDLFPGVDNSLVAGDVTPGGDVTAGAASAWLGPHLLLAGNGVGVVSRPGLGISVGEPAVNPVPRRMIQRALEEVGPGPYAVEISVPGGQEMARHTTNERLGILGGISILGTTGIVKPFSTASWRASVVQQIDVAAAQGFRELALTTGSRSSQGAASLWPHLDPVCIVEVGDFTGVALKRAKHWGFTHIHLAYMVGKLTKLASGTLMTHFHRSNVDTDFLTSLALMAGACQEVVSAASETATARHFLETCLKKGELAPLELLCHKAREQVQGVLGGSAQVDVTLLAFDGHEVLARAQG
jgi:cobalt-precorrin-5B (C1)-methyltransferase